MQRRTTRIYLDRLTKVDKKLEFVEPANKRLKQDINSLVQHIKGRMKSSLNKRKILAQEQMGTHLNQIRINRLPQINLG